MSGYHATTVTRCDSRANFSACPCFGYSAAGEPFDACPCRGYSATAGEPFRCLPLPCVQRGSSKLLYIDDDDEDPIGDEGPGPEGQDVEYHIQEEEQGRPEKR